MTVRDWPPRPGRVDPVPLGRLAEVAGADPPADSGAVVTGLTNRSAEVRPGDLYVGVPGSRTHGARFAADAVAAGAVAVLTDPAGAPEVPPGVPVLVATDVRAAVGPVASEVYGHPSRRLQILGITATSGKTTTSYLVEAGLRAAGRTTGLIGTVETRIAGERLEQPAGASFTTPEAPDLHALLAVMVEAGVDSLAMEVSSHALELGRVGGIRFAVGAFGNLSQDHLDFHGDMDSYFAAKALLFDGRADRHVVNRDDPYGARLAAVAPDRTVTVSPGGHPATWSVRDVRADHRGSSFTAAGPDGVSLPVRVSIAGGFNVDNAVLALAVLVEAGVDPAVAAAALDGVHVPGRMQPVEEGQDFLAVVDYSHKPAAVAAVLDALRPRTPGRLVVVLGCGGDRDRAKRPLMGEAAARRSDLLVVTDDNPRSEDPATIRAAMLDGALAVPPGERGEVVEVGDRAAAIRRAVAGATAGDTVVVAGKGHEHGQYVGDRVLPFDDVAQLAEAVRAVRESR